MNHSQEINKKINIPPWVKTAFLFFLVDEVARYTNSSLTNSLLLKNFLSQFSGSNNFNSNKYLSASIKSFLIPPLFTYTVFAVFFLLLCILLKLPRKISVIFTIIIFLTGCLYSYIGVSSLINTAASFPKNQPSSYIFTSPVPTPTPASSINSGFYSNPDYNLSFSFPQTDLIKEYDFYYNHYIEFTHPGSPVYYFQINIQNGKLKYSSLSEEVSHWRCASSDCTVNRLLKPISVAYLGQLIYLNNTNENYWAAYFYDKKRGRIFEFLSHEPFATHPEIFRILNTLKT